MRWERFFEDLDDQLDSEWEAERAALDTEAERLRLARVPLRDRLVALSTAGDQVSLELAAGLRRRGVVQRVGADWCALQGGEGAQTVSIVPLSAVLAVAVSSEALLSSVRRAEPGTASSRRMSFGFVVRDIVRRRSAMSVHLIDGRVLTGTADRAGADHLDLALHERDQPRRADAVTGMRLVAFSAVVALDLDAAGSAPTML